MSNRFVSGALFLFLLIGAFARAALTSENQYDLTDQGNLVIVQGATSDTVTHFSVMLPKLKDYYYEIADRKGQVVAAAMTKTKVAMSEGMHWKVDKLRVEGLSPNRVYQLRVWDSRGRKEVVDSSELVDHREFKMLDINKKGSTPKFALLSCLSDAFKFRKVREKMWRRLEKENPAFIIINGDVVYVDGFEFVPRISASESDIWLRYVDSLRNTPLFFQKRLRPILATWDDHDFGTDNSNKTFASREVSSRVFHAFFGSDNIDGVFEMDKNAVNSAFHAFGQSFYLMDDRYHREAESFDLPYAHWGQAQHEWLLASINAKRLPSWIINGDQIFMDKVVVEDRKINESMLGDHPTHLKQLVADLRASGVPVIFASGDVHFSEVMNIEADFLGYPTYEITASPGHSYIYHHKPNWENPRRLIAGRDHNYVMLQATATPTGWSELTVRAEGFKCEDEALFGLRLSVSTEPAVTEAPAPEPAPTDAPAPPAETASAPADAA